MQILLFLIFLFTLMCFHELGHILIAKILNLSVQKIGFHIKPYLHFFVAVKYPKNNLHKYVFLFSGSFLTILLFTSLLFKNFFDLPSLYWAFVIQLAIETNPFYSDFTIALVSNNKLDKKTKSYVENYKIQFKKYQYTAQWYLHFIIWTFIIILLIKL